MKKYYNGYSIEEKNGLYEIRACGDLVQKEPTEELAILWTYSELYRVLKEDYR